MELDVFAELCCVTICSGVSIDSWILPVVYAGHINAVAWLCPFWTDHSFALDSCFQVGKDPETQQIRLIL